MKILELTNFTAGVCGVGARVKQEALELSKRGHEVQIFSSDFTKGNSEIATESEMIGTILIKRFSAIMPGRGKLKLIPGGESFMSWNFIEEALAFKPNVIIAHSYRHKHTTKALKIAKKLKCKVFLVSHAPFVSGMEKRSLPAKLSVWFYDKFIAPLTLNKFDKVIAITKWEIPFLKQLNVSEEKIEYIPNGIPEEFFTEKQNVKEVKNKLLFLGRITPIKDLETAIKALSLIDNKKINLEIVGPPEQDYLEELEQLIEGLNVKDKVTISPPIYDLKQKISKIDSSSLFILPSKREAMPQALIEAMARKKIVVASDNLGAKDLIQNGKNGFLFQIGNVESLAHAINKVIAMKSKDLNKIRSAAKDSVIQFSWDKITNKIEKIIN